MSIKKIESIKTPPELGIIQSTGLDWDIIKKHTYEGNTDALYKLLKEVKHENISNPELQRYYFYLGKYYHINDYLSSAVDMYSKSYLYAQISSHPVLEAKKSAINITNILKETLGANASISRTLLDSQNNTVVSETLTVEKLLKFSLDNAYPRAYYLLASYYSNIFFDNIKDFGNEQKIIIIDLILSNLNQYFKLETGNEKMNILDTSQAVLLKKEFLQFRNRIKDRIERDKN